MLYLLDKQGGIDLTRKGDRFQYRLNYLLSLSRQCRDRTSMGRRAGILGPFRAVPVRMADRREKLPNKILSHCHEQARRVYHGAVFEIKKKLRTKTSVDRY